MDIDYLVTGGAGFIGCAFAAGSRGVARQCSSTILAVDNLHPQIHPDRGRPSMLPEHVDLRQFHVCDAASWSRLLAEVRPRVIVHLAAETGTGQSLDLPTRHTDTNVTGTACMLEALDASGHLPEQVLLTSSRAVYGEGLWRDPATGLVFAPGNRSRERLLAGAFAFDAPSGAVAEPLAQAQRVTPASPTSVYGATKLTQEHLLQSWCSARGISLSVLRLQNVYGAGQSPFNAYTGIVGLFHRVAAGGGTIEVYEDGQIGRDFIYIDDVAAAMWAAVSSPPAPASVVDVGTGIGMTILEAATMIAELYGAPRPVVSGAFRFGDVRWAVAATEALNKVLGVAPKISFLEGNLRLSQWLFDGGVIPKCADQGQVAVAS